MAKQNKAYKFRLYPTDEQALQYKLKEQGKQLIKIDKWFPSTKSGSKCCSVKEIKLSERTYQCPCKLNIDRDYNSALNIKKEGIRLLASA